MYSLSPGPSIKSRPCSSSCCRCADTACACCCIDAVGCPESMPQPLAVQNELHFSCRAVMQACAQLCCRNFAAFDAQGCLHCMSTGSLCRPHCICSQGCLDSMPTKLAVQTLLNLMPKDVMTACLKLTVQSLRYLFHRAVPTACLQAWCTDCAALVSQVCLDSMYPSSLCRLCCI